MLNEKRKTNTELILFLHLFKFKRFDVHSFSSIKAF